MLLITLSYDELAEILDLDEYVPSDETLLEALALMGDDTEDMPFDDE